MIPRRTQRILHGGARDRVEVAQGRSTLSVMPRFDYRTEILTSMVGREKLRLDDLDDLLKKYGDEGWELVSVALDADLRGSRDGHLLVFKRQRED
jgi:hypothetical protein